VIAHAVLITHCSHSNSVALTAATTTTAAAAGGVAAAAAAVFAAVAAVLQVNPSGLMMPVDVQVALSDILNLAAAWA
jgi:hypothetical protein